jgi:hypothetical protein
MRLKINQICEIVADLGDKEGENYPSQEFLEDLIGLSKNGEEGCELLDQYRHMLLMG